MIVEIICPACKLPTREDDPEVLSRLRPDGVLENFHGACLGVKQTQPCA